MKFVWYRIIGDNDDKCVHLTDDYLYVGQLREAVNTEEKHRVPENVGTEMIHVFASIIEYKNKNPFGGRDKIPSDTYEKPLRILLPSRLPLPSDDEVATAILGPENESIPSNYKEVAQIYTKNRQSAEEVIQQIERMQCSPEFGKSPLPFVCIFDSSGTGKTQFAVTTAYLRETAKVVYLYTGQLENDNAQQGLRTAPAFVGES